MTTRTLMTASAAFLGVLGAAFLFAPLETAGLLSLATHPDAEPAVTLVGSALVAVALLDWMGRNAIYGGIYGRPIAMANLFVGTFFGLELVRVQARAAGGGTAVGWAVAILFLVHAVAFWGVVRARPWIRSGPS